jgi:hypothetical protein
MQFRLVVLTFQHSRGRVKINKDYISGVPRGFGGFKPPPEFRNFDKVPKIKKILLYEMKFLVSNYSCLQNP